MGLDFGIEKRRKGENYKGLAFEDCCSWLNITDKFFIPYTFFGGEYGL